MTLANKAPLGVLDSGVGGLSVVREISRLLPHEDILYLADSGNCPYGVRPVEEIRRLTFEAASFLRQQGAKALVIACNTASTASVAYLRRCWPDLPIVGMVPAVKPAATLTRSGKIGVLATRATGRAPVLLDVIDRFASEVGVIIATPPGLVEAVEQGQAEAPATVEVLRQTVEAMVAAGADTLVLGCTHFPFLRPALQTIAGHRLKLVDSGEAVARQTARVLEGAGLLNRQDRPGKLTCFTSGDPAQARAVFAKLIGLAEPQALDLRVYAGPPAGDPPASTPVE